MDLSDKPEEIDEVIPFTKHETDPDGVYVPPPTAEQMANRGKTRCKVYNREDWGGRLPRETPVMYTPVTKVILSRTETEPCFTHEDCKLRVREMQNTHMDEEGEPDIKYHFMVGGDGAVYEGRGYTTVGRSYPPTPKNMQDLSKSSLEIAFIQPSNRQTTEMMQYAAHEVITLGRSANHIYKQFELYFVADGEIRHVQEVGGAKGEESSSKEESNTTEAAGPAEDTGQSLEEGKDGKNEFQRDVTEKPEFIETGSEEYPTHSNVPEHDSPIQDEKDDSEQKTQPVPIIYRHVWGAQPPKWIHALNLPINKVAISFTETDPCYSQEECSLLLKKLQAKHMEETEEPDIKHNFLIGGDGLIYEGRGYTRVGPIYPASARKVEDLNQRSIDVGIIDRSAGQPTMPVIHGISWCLSTGVHKKFIEKNFVTYYIANNEIIHIQFPKSGAEKRKYT